MITHGLEVISDCTVLFYSILVTILSLTSQQFLWKTNPWKQIPKIKMSPTKAVELERKKWKTWLQHYLSWVETKLSTRNCWTHDDQCCTHTQLIVMRGPPGNRNTSGNKWGRYVTVVSLYVLRQWIRPKMHQVGQCLIYRGGMMGWGTKFGASCRYWCPSRRRCISEIHQRQERDEKSRRFTLQDMWDLIQNSKDNHGELGF